MADSTTPMPDAADLLALIMESDLTAHETDILQGHRTLPAAYTAAVISGTRARSASNRSAAQLMDKLETVMRSHDSEPDYSAFVLAYFASGPGLARLTAADVGRGVFGVVLPGGTHASGTGIELFRATLEELRLGQ